MAFLLGLLLVGVIGAALVAGFIALRNKQAFTRDAKLGPGLATSAPTAWAGSHDPEARLHRRLRDAVAALAANQSFDFDGSLLDLRVELEQQAVALDEQLVATAALPMHMRSDPLGRISEAVVALEQAVADLAGASADEAAQRLALALRDISDRTGMVAQARVALDAMETDVTGGSAAALPPTPPTAERPPGEPTPNVEPGPTEEPGPPEEPGTSGTTGQAF